MPQRGLIEVESQESVNGLHAPRSPRTNPFLRSRSTVIGLAVLVVMFVACLGTLPWTLGSAVDGSGRSLGVPRYDAGMPREGRLPPNWWPHDQVAIARAMAAVDPETVERLAGEHDSAPNDILEARDGPLLEVVRPFWPSFALGSDMLGRSLAIRLLAGGGVSLTIGIAAALISVSIGTLYGAIAAYAGGAVDSIMMRIVDVLYGLPYILLVVLLAVASDAVIDEWVTKSKAKQTWMVTQLVESNEREGDSVSRADARILLASDEAVRDALQRRANELHPRRELSAPTRTLLDVLTLLFAIGAVSWLTMARVIRGQVLSLKGQPFVESARSIGSSPLRIFVRHLLPNLIGPIVVYATLAVPQAILQESFLSFLGIGVKPPLPSWGNLAAEGLGELNTYRSHWWLLFFPCLLLGITLLAMNFVGEGLREAFDPRRSR